jgi:hypothetical protein
MLKLLLKMNPHNNNNEIKEIINNYPSGTSFFNYFLEDYLSDYLDKYGSIFGFNMECPPEDVQMIMDKGKVFESKVVELIKSKDIPVIEIGDMEWVDGAFETFQLMKLGHPIIAQGYLINNENKTKGRPDLLIRSDYLNQLKPGLLTVDEEKTPSIFGNWHYRVIDIKMTNLALTANGKNITNSKIFRAYKAQVLVYTLGVGCIQGYKPPHGYLLGRSAYNYDNSIFFDDCFTSITPIDYRSYDAEVINDLKNAIEWLDLVDTLPLISKITDIHGVSKYNWEFVESFIPKRLNIDLRPNMKNTYDYKWKLIKNKIAIDREDLTLLWNCGVAKRNKALKNGVKNWHDYMLFCRENPSYQNDIIAQIININRAENDTLFYPTSLDKEHTDLIPSRINPFIVIDFETTNNINDDFDFLPEKGGCDLVFLIGITVVIPGDNEKEHQYRYFPFSVKYCGVDHEREILIKMLDLLAEIKQSLNLNSIQLYHWSNAEASLFEKLYDRHTEYLSDYHHNIIEYIYFIDVLSIFKNQPIIIKGAYDFGLKSVAKAMHNNGMIKTIWKNDMNGLLTMLKFNNFSEEAGNIGIYLNDFEEMNDIIIYNMTDCQVLAEIIVFLQNTYLEN